MDRAKKLVKLMNFGLYLLLTLTLIVEASNVLRGGATSSLDSIISKMERLTGSSSSRSPSPTNREGGDLSSFKFPGHYTINELMKEARGRRKFIMQHFSSVFWDMKNLASKDGYIITMYRENQKHPITAHFPQNTDSFYNHSKANQSHLIQSFSDTDPSKKLCIYTKNDLTNFAKLEEFVKNMIAAKTDKAKELVFKTYKSEIGLPTGVKSFDYSLYAWVTSSDCAFYNLGNPVYTVYPPDHISPADEPASTEVLSESFIQQYSVQVSHLTAQSIPVSIIKVDRNSTEMQVKLFNLNNESLIDLYSAFKPVSAINFETKQSEKSKASCGALFVDGAVFDDGRGVKKILSEALDIYSSTRYIKTLRTSFFFDELRYFNLFKQIPSTSNSVSFMSWEPLNGSCHFPENIDKTILKPDQMQQTAIETKTSH